VKNADELAAQVNDLKKKLSVSENLVIAFANACNNNTATGRVPIAAKC
jgi:hypothetical protein